MMYGTTIDFFHVMVAETIRDCQAIEHDVKLMLASLMVGELEDNLDFIYKNNLTVGQAVNKLEKLDNSDNDPYLSKDDYEVLKEITGKRNRIVHHCYNNFEYENDDNKRNQLFNEERKFLKEFHVTVGRLWKVVQDVTHRLMAEYGRE